VPCADGTKPNLDQSDCEVCAPGEAGVGGMCAACDAGKTPVADSSECQTCPTGKQPNDDQSDCVQCPVGQATATGACTACITGWVPVASAAGDTQARCEVCFAASFIAAISPSDIACLSSVSRVYTLMVAWLGVSRYVQLASSHRHSNQLAKTVYLAMQPILATASSVMLEKRLLRTEVHARCVLLAKNQHRSKQLAKTAYLAMRQMSATASSVMKA
jgi:hypothetical protein